MQLVRYLRDYRRGVEILSFTEDSKFTSVNSPFRSQKLSGSLGTEQMKLFDPYILAPPSLGLPTSPAYGEV